MCFECVSSNQCLRTMPPENSPAVISDPNSLILRSFGRFRERSNGEHATDHRADLIGHNRDRLREVPVAGGVYGPSVDSALMDAIQVRVERVDLSVTFALGRFISDWQSAQRTFIAGIVREYGALFPTRSQDFVSNPSPLLSESWCRYMILGNTAHITLCPDSLQLGFTGLRQEDLSTTVRTTLYGAARLLSTDFNEFGRGSTVFTTNGQ